MEIGELVGVQFENESSVVVVTATVGNDRLVVQSVGSQDPSYLIDLVDLLTGWNRRNPA